MSWLVEYEFKAQRRKYIIGVYDTRGATGASVSEWLKHGRLSVAQARAIAGHWKLDRRAGRDPLVEWEIRLAKEKAEEAAVRQAAVEEAQQPLVRDVVEQFLTKQILGKKSAPAICPSLPPSGDGLETPRCPARN